MNVRHIAKDADLAGLADLILDRERTRPLVVLTPGRRRFDLRRLCAGLADSDALVCILRRRDDVERLRSATYGEMSAYGGAACVWPSDGSRHVVAARDESSEAYLARVVLTRPHADRRRRPRGAKTPTLRDRFDMADPESRLEWMACELGRPRDGWDATDAFTRRLARADDPKPVLKCVARVLDGVDRSHALRSGPAGSPPARRDGRIIWRAYVANNTPNAWRVHYVRDGPGHVLLLECGGHDELV